MQLVSATESNAYPGTLLHRTQALITLEQLQKPLLLDLFRVATSAEHNYDLPFYFNGQLLETNFSYQQPEQLQPLGDSHGYQHLYLEGQGAPSGDNAALTWLNQGKFYTLTTATDSDDQLLFTRIGANDPQFNLRRDAAFMLRRQQRGDTLFATLVEPHGSYSPVTERSANPRGSVEQLTVEQSDDRYSAVSFRLSDGTAQLFILANGQTDAEHRHQLTLNGVSYQWQGGYFFGPL